MLTALAAALGIACVAWTTFELTRLLHARPGATGPSAGASRVARFQAACAVHAASRASRELAAWDDRGRRIPVEDLGLR